MDELLPEGWVLASWIAKDELPRVSTRLRIKDANMVLADVRVRPMKFAIAVHSRPIEDTVLESFCFLLVHA